MADEVDYGCYLKQENGEAVVEQYPAYDAMWSEAYFQRIACFLTHPILNAGEEELFEVHEG